MPRPKLPRTSLFAAAAALLAACPAWAGFDQTLAGARNAVAFARTPEGMQARYDAARDLEEAVFALRSPQPSCRLQASLVLAHGLVR